ncbi:MAG: hypothetical protein J7513_01470 [Solirubrobacteraceae bacterium]|nr:hypothetical protein [Solirubrobacteraceae bacterium]
MGRSSLLTHAVGAVLGASAVVPSVLLVRRRTANTTALAGAGLVIAAAIYPAARTDRLAGPAGARELAGLVAAGLLATAAAGAGGTRGRRLIAAGWASHALFDAAHDTGRGSSIPAWYPAACAAFDLVLASELWRAD